MAIDYFYIIRLTLIVQQWNQNLFGSIWFCDNQIIMYYQNAVLF